MCAYHLTCVIATARSLATLYRTSLVESIDAQSNEVVTKLFGYKNKCDTRSSDKNVNASEWRVAKLWITCSFVATNCRIRLHLRVRAAAGGAVVIGNIKLGG
jgi:hypothetical protein